MSVWGNGPLREYTRSKMCPGPLGSPVEPHLSRWWRWLDPGMRDGWHCLACDHVMPEASPIDGSPTAVPERRREKPVATAAG